MDTRSIEVGNRDDNEKLFWEMWVVKSNYDLMEVEEDDLEFEVLVGELNPDMSLWLMSMKMTGKKFYEKIASMPS